MKKRYAEIDNPGESSPLTGDASNTNHRRPSSSSPNSRPSLTLILGSIIVILSVWLIRIHRKAHVAGTVVISPPSPASTSSTRAVEPPQLIRSLCLVFGGRRARLIQTSMKEPSQQWSPVTCFQPERGPLLSPLKRRPTVQLNAFGAPDAILQVDFSTLAHANSRIPILGFGGAFTEAAARNFHRLSPTGQDAVLELLFGATGLGYALGRIPMNSCDFSLKSYSFDTAVDDFDLVDFDTNVTHDVRTGMVNMALRAVDALQEGWGRGRTTPPRRDDVVLLPDGILRLGTSPWSPPAWMKKPTWQDPANATRASRMTYSAQPSCLLEGMGPNSRYAKTWALYFSKFLTAYKRLGLNVTAVSVQNEPEFPAPWEACSYTPKTQRNFVAHHLGPQLAADHPDVKIFIFDHNKDHINNWTDTILANTSAAKPYVSGTAYHWYAGGT